MFLHGQRSPPKKEGRKKWGGGDEGRPVVALLQQQDLQTQTYIVREDGKDEEEKMEVVVSDGKYFHCIGSLYTTCSVDKGLPAAGENVTEDKSSSQEVVTTGEIILGEKGEKSASSSKDSVKQAWTEPADKPSDVVSSEETPSSNNVEETIPDIEEDKVLPDSKEESESLVEESVVKVKQAWTEPENDPERTHNIDQRKDKEKEQITVAEPPVVPTIEERSEGEVQPPVKPASPCQSSPDNKPKSEAGGKISAQSVFKLLKEQEEKEQALCPKEEVLASHSKEEQEHPKEENELALHSPVSSEPHIRTCYN